jgi:ArsR family transcriptional regulator
MKQMESYFRALADASRLRIINLLLHGELCGCDIQRVLDTAQPNVSRHLTYLKHAGLVTDRRDGYRVFYRLIHPAPAALDGLLAYLRGWFPSDQTLLQDLALLGETVKSGACSTQYEERDHA